MNAANNPFKIIPVMASHFRDSFFTTPITPKTIPASPGTTKSTILKVRSAEMESPERAFSKKDKSNRARTEKTNKVMDFAPRFKNIDFSSQDWQPTKYAGL
jgi:hypothetical protein